MRPRRQGDEPDGASPVRTWLQARWQALGHVLLPPRPEVQRLEPAPTNPILAPDQRHAWESKAVFNPAAVLIDDEVHLLYRAIGEQDRSSLGHATSKTGLDFSKPTEMPAYVAREAFEGHAHHVHAPHPGSYASGGGGWGGVEDPRVTQIGDRVYMTYVAYNGIDPPRVALTSIRTSDFRARRWTWAPPVLISEPGVVNKNAVLFPEKVRDRFVMIHRVYPNILLDYLDDLDFDGKTRWLVGQHVIPPSTEGWDNHKVGAGPPPIKTHAGWLLICQGVGKEEGYRYKSGAMLLDLRRPERVLVRPKEPILEPDAWYTNQGWKAGVVYPCGAVVKNGHLLVYYGGADTYVCVATAPFDAFVNSLARRRRPHMVLRPLGMFLDWTLPWRRSRAPV
ncbi:MAG: glycosidase [Planctomycetota bacterium]